MNFKLRNESGLHCMFCGEEYEYDVGNNLFEIEGGQGIICESCKRHLERLIENSKAEERERLVKELKDCKNMEDVKKLIDWIELRVAGKRQKEGGK